MSDWQTKTTERPGWPGLSSATTERVPRPVPATPAGPFQSSPEPPWSQPCGRRGQLSSGGEGRRCRWAAKESRNPLPPPPTLKRQRLTYGTHTFLSLCFILTVLCSRESPSSLAASVSFSSMVFKRLVSFLSVTSLSFFIKNNLKKK